MNSLSEEHNSTRVDLAKTAICVDQVYSLDIVLKSLKLPIAHALEELDKMLKQVQVFQANACAKLLKNYCYTNMVGVTGGLLKLVGKAFSHSLFSMRGYNEESIREEDAFLIEILCQASVKLSQNAISRESTQAKPAIPTRRP